MTARLRDVSDAVALATPGSYESEINCARVIAEYLSQMPLEVMSRRASELVLLRTVNNKRLRRDREIVELLASTKRQLLKIRARYSE